MAADLELLLKLGEEGTRKFIHGVINNLCQKEGVHYEEYNSKLSLSEYSRLKITLAGIIKKSIRRGMDRKQLLETLGKFGVPQEVGGVIAECVWVRREEVHKQLVQDSSSLSHCSLEDYDLKTKLVLASDKLGSIQEPLISLDLTLNEGGKEKCENLELSQVELVKLVSALEAANKVVLQVRT